MVNCSVLGCKSNTLRQIENVSFHRFPKESTVFIHWVNATGRREWLPTKDCRICSKHFETECFRRTEHASYLKKGSIPKLNVKISDEPIFEKLCTCKHVQIRTTGTQTMPSTKSRSTQTISNYDDPDRTSNGTGSRITRMRNMSIWKTFTTIPLTAAERQKRYREKLKQNKVKYEQVVHKRRESYQITKRLVKDLTPTEKENAKILWKLRKREYRKQKKVVERSVLQQTPQTPRDQTPAKVIWAIS